ncbi:MAG: SapC family protein [Alphaproteobacteria bacterium]
MAKNDAKSDVKSKENGAGTSAQKQSGAMPIFYKNPLPLDAKAHAHMSLRKNFGFGFTKDTNAIPINLIEMPQICHSYPIAFGPDENATPVAVLGLRDNENLFYDAKTGLWEEATYIPAYIRRYPFILSEMPGNDQLALCIDADDSIIEKGDSQPFFGADGKPSALCSNALEFCKSYHAAAKQTQAFGKMLAQSGLLVQREAQITVAGNKRIKFSGFRIIDEQKLAKMDDKTFLEWRTRGWLPYLYAHLFSGAQWQRLTWLLNQRLEKEAA